MTQTHRLLAGAPGLVSVPSNSFDVLTSGGGGFNVPAALQNLKVLEQDYSLESDLPVSTSIRGRYGALGYASCTRASGRQALGPGATGQQYINTFPANLVAGTGPGSMRYTPTQSPTVAYSHVYQRYEGLQIGASVAQGGDAQYQNHAVETKMTHLKMFALGGGTGAAIVRVEGTSPGNVLQARSKIAILSKQVGILYKQNVVGTGMLNGVPHTLEWEWKINSGKDVADGIWRVWQDGVLVANHINAIWVTALGGDVGTLGVYDFWDDHTYGGSPPGAPPNPPGTRTRSDKWYLTKRTIHALRQ